MHPYATDSNERPLVLFLLAAVAIVVIWLLDYGFKATHISLPWWLSAPSVLGLYGLLYATFDRWGWRLPLLRKSGLVKVPDLDGTWTGYVTSSFDSHATKFDAVITISQTWTRFSVVLKTASSESKSLTGSVASEGHQSITLTYEFLNDPNADAAPSMQIHRGVAHLALSRTGAAQVLDGDYYTGRGRQTVGVLHFEKA